MNVPVHAGGFLRTRNDRRRRGGVAGRGRPAVLGGEDQSCLKASFTFSPACFTSALNWSPLPSASRLLSSVALPAASLAEPPAFSAAFSILSSSPMTSPFDRSSRISHQPGCASTLHDPAA